MRKVNNSEKENLNKYQSGIGALLVISTIITPPIIAICINNISSPDTGPRIAIPVLILVLIIQVFAFIFSYRATKINTHYVEYNLLKQEKDKLEEHLLNSKSIYSQVFSCNQAMYMSTVALDDYIGSYNNDPNLDDNKSRIGKILNPFIKHRAEIFGLTNESLYNIALYKYDSDNDKLIIHYRFCDDRIPQKNRDWVPGHGHIGLAFIRKKAILSMDASSSDELEYDNSTEDNKHYRSFFSVPIIATWDDADSHIKPLGVLVVTSSKEYEFSRDIHESTLLALSKLIAIYFQVETAKQMDMAEK